MIRPDIKTYREDRTSHWISSDKHRSHFLGTSAFDLHTKKKEPFANIRKDGILFEIDVMMPGFKKDEIAVTVTDDVLTVRAEKSVEPRAASEYVIREYDVDSIERKFYLAKGFGHDKIHANYENGILRLQFEDTCDVIEKMKKHVEVE